MSSVHQVPRKSVPEGLIDLRCATVERLPVIGRTLDFVRSRYGETCFVQPSSVYYAIIYARFFRVQSTLRLRLVFAPLLSTYYLHRL